MYLLLLRVTWQLITCHSFQQLYHFYFYLFHRLKMCFLHSSHSSQSRGERINSTAFLRSIKFELLDANNFRFNNFIAEAQTYSRNAWKVIRAICNLKLQTPFLTVVDNLRTTDQDKTACSLNNSLSKLIQDDHHTSAKSQHSLTLIPNFLLPLVTRWLLSSAR